MRITGIDVNATPSGARLAGTVVFEKSRRQPETVEFVYRGVDVQMVTTPGDALAAAVLIPCMAAGEDLFVEAPVSSKLIDGMERIVDVFWSWNRKWHRSRIDAPHADRSALSPTKVAALFSGGMDSYHTVLRPHPEPITTLITMLGFTQYPWLLPKLESVMKTLADAAARLGKEHIVVESNAFAFGRPFFTSINFHSGGVLLAMPLGLGALVRRCYIASSWSLRLGVVPWGTTPFTDPMWSTETLEIVHDGAELTRFEKAPVVATSDVALETLRVCTRRRNYVENCGRCDKCVSRALTLELVGAGGRCRTLPRVTPEIVRRTVISPSHMFAFERYRELTSDPEMRHAASVALRKARLRRLVRPTRRLARLIRRPPD